MYCILIPIALKYCAKDAINSKSALGQVMAWRLTGGILYYQATSTIYEHGHLLRIYALPMAYFTKEVNPS